MFALMERFGQRDAWPADADRERLGRIMAIPAA